MVIAINSRGYSGAARSYAFANAPAMPGEGT